MKEIDRFLKKVAKLENDNCWLWKASKTQQNQNCIKAKVEEHRKRQLH